MRTAIALVTAVLASSQLYAANCTKNPSHPSCSTSTEAIGYTGRLPLVVNADDTVVGRLVDYEMPRNKGWLLLRHDTGTAPHYYRVPVYITNDVSSIMADDIMRISEVYENTTCSGAPVYRISSSNYYPVPGFWGSNEYNLFQFEGPSFPDVPIYYGRFFPRQTLGANTWSVVNPRYGCIVGTTAIDTAVVSDLTDVSAKFKAPLRYQLD